MASNKNAALCPTQAVLLAGAWGRLWGLLLGLVCAVFAVALPAQAVAPEPDAQLEACLKLGGANRAQLELALERASALDQASYDAMCFLITTSPTVDLGIASAELLLENVTLALQVRREFAYGQDYDDATWRNYVLPLRVSQEPLSPWRRYFYDQLKDKVKDCRTIGEAATIAGEYYATLATYKPTQRRDQSPLATMAGGYGRCEELVILFIDCCRSVGIPARMAYCPYWAHCDDNHAWWEVLGSDGAWHMDAPYSELENREASWVTHSARQAPIVIAMAAGERPADGSGDDESPPQNDGIQMFASTIPGASYVQLNATQEYRQTGLLTISAPEGTPELDPATGKPWRLNVSIFNYGALRLVARPEFHDGYVMILLGVGDYILSTSFTTGPRTTLIQVYPYNFSGGTWDELPEAPSDFVLYFPKDPPPGP